MTSSDLFCDIILNRTDTYFNPTVKMTKEERKEKGRIVSWLMPGSEN